MLQAKTFRRQAIDLAAFDDFPVGKSASSMASHLRYTPSKLTLLTITMREDVSVGRQSKHVVSAAYHLHYWMILERRQTDW